jgi:5'-3' exonuclease
VYVFDGKPTQLKLDELAKRQERRVKAEGDLEAARDTGTIFVEMFYFFS